MAGPGQSDGPLIYLVVGEPSGDQLGAHLVAALGELTGSRARFRGLAGPRMAALGLTSLFPIDDLAVMGVEFVPKLRTILGRIREVADDIVRAHPACVVLIDSQGFSYRVAKRLRGHGIPVVQYVAPTVWAWRAARARKIARLLDHVLTIFPFEPPYFERHGLAATFVGHQAAEEELPDPSAGPALRARLGIPADAPLLCVLPGSRAGEVARLAPVYGEALRLVAERVPGLRCLVPTVAAVAGAVADAAAAWPVPAHPLDGADKLAAFAASDAALAASGTVTAETAFAELPTVVAYKVAWYAERIGRAILKTPYVCAVNVVMDCEAMPEYVLERCRPGPIADAVTTLLTDQGARAAQRQLLREAKSRMAVPGEKPGHRAARAVLALINGND